MAPVRRFLLRLASFFRSGRAEAELAREINAHLQLLEDEFLAALVGKLTGGGLMNGNGAVLLPAVAALMTAVGLLASVGAARRGLRVQPTEALREQ